MDQEVNQIGQPAQEASRLDEFSEAFNTMTRQLKEREDQLKREIQRAQRRAEIIESYAEMLVELLAQRDEWMLVVDRETREIVHCNKRTRGGEEGGIVTAASTGSPFSPSCWSGTTRSGTASGNRRKGGGAAATALFPSTLSGRSGPPGSTSSWMSPQRR